MPKYSFRFGSARGFGGTIKAEEKTKAYQVWFREAIRLRMHHVLTSLRRWIMQNLSKGGGGIPSSPGEYPRMQTGDLKGSIITTIDTTTLTGEILTNVQHGLWLEFDTQGGVVIVPKSSRFLSWVDPRTGVRRYARRVIQGAIKRRSFIGRTYKERKQWALNRMVDPLPPFPRKK